jgi:lipoate-protein ligase A
VSVISVLPFLRAGGGAQMALDDGLLDEADAVVARRYTWAPPALSLGKFQKLDAVPGLPFEIVRRPTGGRAVLHGEDFEWSFAVVFSEGSLGVDARAGADPSAPYDLVSRAFAAAFEELGVSLDGGREAPYQRSALCFATALRHDLFARGEKIAAIAQARRGGRVLVHGSVLERRPPDELTQVAETLLGEPWQGEGLAGAGYIIDAEMLWRRALARLDAGVRLLRRGARLRATAAAQAADEIDDTDRAAGREERSEA